VRSISDGQLGSTVDHKISLYKSVAYYDHAKL
jgi:hypothetical protein